MKTINGHIYAQIQNGLVFWVFDSITLPEFNEDTFDAVDITSLSPQPALGWSYDGTKFTAPVVTVNLKYEAQLALDQNDRVATRCLKAGVAYPTNWLAFDVALRAIINGTDTTSTTLPATPSYPVGT